MTLVFFIDSDLSMRSHVQRTVAQFTLVLSSLDYCNATLAGLPVGLHNRLQSVLNASARPVAVSLFGPHR